MTDIATPDVAEQTPPGPEGESDASVDAPEFVEDPLPEGRFVDLGGRPYDFSKLKGTKVVINALSPT